MISDKLFLAWNCGECTKIKEHVREAMFDDFVIGSDGQILTVVHTFSNDATRDILDTFGLEDHTAPVLITNKEDVISNTEEIISYLKNTGLAK